MLHLLHLSTSPLERNIILSQAPWKGHDFKESDVAISSCHTTQWHDRPGPTAGASKSATQNATTPCDVEPKGDMHQGSVERFRRLTTLHYLTLNVYAENLHGVCAYGSKRTHPQTKSTSYIHVHVLRPGFLLDTTFNDTAGSEASSPCFAEVDVQKKQFGSFRTSVPIF